jgi:hypothetical protein
LPAIKHPFLDQPANHFTKTLTDLLSSHYIKTSRTFRNNSLSIIKFCITITQSFPSYGSLVQILTEINKEESKTSSQTGIEIEILRSEKE